MNSTLFYTTIPFAPSVECGIEFDQALLPDKPEVLLKNMTPIPLLTGLNNLEGLIFLNGMLLTSFIRNLSNSLTKKCSTEVIIVS